LGFEGYPVNIFLNESIREITEQPVIENGKGDNCLTERSLLQNFRKVYRKKKTSR
jgi:hypothetical protein